MSGVKHATPKDPYALALNIEERNCLEPPLIGLQGEKIEPGEDEFYEAVGGGLDRERFRQDFVRRRFWSSQEFA